MGEISGPWKTMATAGIEVQRSQAIGNGLKDVVLLLIPAAGGLFVCL